jgi:hypothetical protein
MQASRILGNEEVDRLAKEEATEVPPNPFTAIPFSAGKKKTYEAAIGTEASGQVGFLYWLQTVQNADELSCTWWS